MKNTRMIGRSPFMEKTQRSGRSGLSAARSIFWRAGVRDSGRMNKASRRLPAFSTAAAMKGSRSQVVAEQSAENRPDDEADAKHGVEQAEATGSLVLGRNVGDVGRRHGDIGAGQASNGAAEQQHPKLRRERHDDIIDRRARQGNEQHGTPAEVVAQSAEHGREDELHDRIERGHDPDVGRDILGVRHILKESRENREDEAYAYGVEADCGEDDDKGFVHSGSKLTGFPSIKSPPVGPPTLSVAAQMTPLAASAGDRSSSSTPRSGWLATRPGSTAFTRIGVLASAAASVVVSALRVYFASEWAGEKRISVPSFPICCAATLETLTIRAAGARRSSGSRAWMSPQHPNTLTSNAE